MRIHQPKRDNSRAALETRLAKYAENMVAPIHKENIEDLPDETAAKLWDLRRVAYDPVIKPGQRQPPRQFGLIAEEVMAALPEVVPLDGEGLPYAVAYDRLVVLLLAEMRKLRDRVATLEAQAAPTPAPKKKR